MSDSSIKESAETPDGIVLATALIVADLPIAALLLSGALRHAEDGLAIEKTQLAGRMLIIFFGEASRRSYPRALHTHPVGMCCGILVITVGLCAQQLFLRRYGIK